MSKDFNELFIIFIQSVFFRAAKYDLNLKSPIKKIIISDELFDEIEREFREKMTVNPALPYNSTGRFEYMFNGESVYICRERAIAGPNPNCNGGPSVDPS